MQDDQALTLRASKRSDFRLAALVMAFLIILASILSSYPILLLFISFISFVIFWFLFTLGFFKVPNVNLISIIFPAGMVRLDCDSEGIIEGILSGEQWCTRHAAVLRIVSKQGGVHNLLVFSRQQESAQAFRRLHARLRLDAGKRDRQQQVLAS